MEKSNTINELAKALCEVQKTELFALTDKKNPFFKSKYADLSSVWSAIRQPLTDNGLSIVQTMELAVDGVIIETTLLHTSGQYMTGKLLVNPEKKTPQGLGSAITYGRRYALAAIVGISPVDDDAETAMNRSVDNPLPDNIKKAIDNIETIEDLSKYYHDHKTMKNQKEFNSLISKRKAAIGALNGKR